MSALGVWLRRWRGGGRPIPGPAPPRPTTRSGGPDPFAEDNNEFALALYGQLRRQPGNLFFSPFSVRTALGMMQAGAAGETAAQMRAALHVSTSDEALHAAVAETLRRLDAAGGGDCEITVANSLWGQEGAPLRPEFLDRIARCYRGAANLVDFRSDAEAVRAIVNRWVEDATRKRIRDLIPSGGLSGDTRLVLVNAVYFKGMWMLRFPKKGTRTEPFHLEGGGKVKASLMHQLEEVRYAQAAGYQAVDLLYRGGDLSMLVLLPDRKDGLRDLEETLSAGMLEDCVTRMAPRSVEIFLPRFKATWGTVDVSARLAALGMSLAFDSGRANFSGINGYEAPHGEALYLSAVLHKAFVETNEEGTEAAAATAGVMDILSLETPTPPPVPTFRADHPFLFAIRDGTTGAILFLGRIADPTRES